MSLYSEVSRKPVSRHVKMPDIFFIKTQMYSMPLLVNTEPQYQQDVWREKED